MGPRGLRGGGTAAGALQRYRPQGSLIRGGRNRNAGLGSVGKGEYGHTDPGPQDLADLCTQGVCLPRREHTQLRGHWARPPFPSPSLLPKPLPSVRHFHHGRFKGRGSRSMPRSGCPLRSLRTSRFGPRGCSLAPTPPCSPALTCPSQEMHSHHSRRLCSPGTAPLAPGHSAVSQPVTRGQWGRTQEPTEDPHPKGSTYWLSEGGDCNLTRVAWVWAWGPTLPTGWLGTWALPAVGSSGWGWPSGLPWRPGTPGNNYRERVLLSMIPHRRLDQKDPISNSKRHRTHCKEVSLLWVQQRINSYHI